MLTELQERSAEIVGGHYIDVINNNISSARLHRVLEQISRLCFFMLECDSNNTSSKVKPSDVRYIRNQWNIVKDEFAFSTAEENNDLPASNYEYGFKIYTPHQKEIARVRNVKIKAVLAEIWDAMNVFLSVDSANTQGYTAYEDSLSINARLNFVDRVMDRWIGHGKDFQDTGLQAPAYEILGKVVPDVDADFAVMSEPSKKMSEPRLSDSPDSVLVEPVGPKPIP